MLRSIRRDFFLVEAISDQQLVLTSRDTHLAVMVSMDLDEQRKMLTHCRQTFGAAR
ncbi:hypothetical protein D3C81_1853340 [compost metagenome]